MIVFFENLTIVSCMFFIFLIVNWILFTIQLVNFFLYIILDYKNLKFKHLIDNISIHFLSFWEFCKYERLKKIYNLTVNLSKFTSNKKILSEIVVLEYK